MQKYQAEKCLNLVGEWSYNENGEHTRGTTEREIVLTFEFYRHVKCHIAIIWIRMECGIKCLTAI